MRPVLFSRVFYLTKPTIGATVLQQQIWDDVTSLYRQIYLSFREFVRSVFPSVTCQAGLFLFCFPPPLISPQVLSGWLGERMTKEVGAGQPGWNMRNKRSTLEEFGLSPHAISLVCSSSVPQPFVTHCSLLNKLSSAEFFVSALLLCCTPRAGVVTYWGLVRDLFSTGWFCSFFSGFCS